LRDTIFPSESSVGGNFSLFSSILTNDKKAVAMRYVGATLILRLIVCWEILMFKRLAVIVSSSVTLALATVAASAATIPIQPDSIVGPNTYTLLANNTYVDTKLIGQSAQVNLVYTFNVTPTLASHTTFTILDPNPPGVPSQYGVANLYALWTGLAQGVRITDDNGIVLNTTLSLGASLASNPMVFALFTTFNAIGPYLAGGALTDGGTVSFKIQVAECASGPQCVPGETPLPGAVALFGSVLAGGVGGMQILRRRRKAIAA
jgi:hypothetical protein